MTLGKAILLKNWKLFEMAYFKQAKQDFASTKNFYCNDKIDEVLLNFKMNSTYNWPQFSLFHDSVRIGQQS